MGNCLGTDEAEEGPSVPQCVREVFDQYAGDDEVITSKQLLKFFQESQGDKAILRGPIASLLLAFPSTTKSSAATSTEGVSEGATAKKSVSKIASSIGQLGSNILNHSGGGSREKQQQQQQQQQPVAGKDKKFRSSSLEQPPAKLRFSKTFSKTFYTTGSKKNKAPDPNILLFFDLLLNPVATKPVSNMVSQDMTRPLSHYFIYTGHNSYLKGNQLTSESSTKPIVKSLHKGVRVIELDLWPNREGDDILVMHGGTLTKPVGFPDCIRAIKENAFAASDYPVIITLEDHLPAHLQAKAADVMIRILGDTLYYPKGNVNMQEFPSPFSLRRKILISTMPPKQDAEIPSADVTSPVIGEPLAEESNMLKGKGEGEKESETKDERKSRHWEEGSGNGSITSVGVSPSDKPLSHVPEVAVAAAGEKQLQDEHDRQGSGKQAGAQGRGQPDQDGMHSTPPLPPDTKGRLGGHAAVRPLAAHGNEASDCHADGGVEAGSEGAEHDPVGGGSSRGSIQRGSSSAAVGPQAAEAGSGAAGPSGAADSSRGAPSCEVGAALPGSTTGSAASDAQAGEGASQLSERSHNKGSQENRATEGDEIQGESRDEQAPEYRRLITIPGGRLRGATLSEGLKDQEFVRRVSLSETQISNAFKAFPTALVRFMQRNLVRVYPMGLRFLSSNYNPTMSWLLGAQMVALNMQGYGRNLWLVHGFFLANGGCGYVLKPEFYMQRKGGLEWKPGSGPAGGRIGSSQQSRLERSGSLPHSSKEGDGHMGGAPELGRSWGNGVVGHEDRAEVKPESGEQREEISGEPGVDSARGGTPEASLTPRESAAAPCADDTFNPHQVQDVQLILKMKVVVGVDLDACLASESSQAETGPSEVAASSKKVPLEAAKSPDTRRPKLDYSMKVSTEGLPSDTDERWLDEQRHTNPNWENQVLEFSFRLPELALLCLEVFASDRLAGQVVLPVAAILPGFRCVSLCDKKGKSLVKAQQDGKVWGPRLLCHFQLQTQGAVGTRTDRS